MRLFKHLLLTIAFTFLAILCFAQAPVAHYTTDCKTLCLNGPRGLGNTTLNFNYNGTGGTPTSYSWVFPAGTMPATSTAKSPQSVDFSVAALGAQLVTVTVANGSDTSSFTDTVFLVKKCQANYTVSSSSICPGSCVTYFDHSNFQPDTWTWTFTGASVTTVYDKNPGTVCYPNPGTFTVEIKASRTNNCFFQNDFNPGPVINVSGKCSNVDSLGIQANHSSICAGNSITYSLPPVKGDSITYKWQFSGGSPSGYTLGNTPPSITYNTPGLYTTTLILTTPTHSDTLTYPVTVNNCSGDTIKTGSIGDTLCTCSTYSLPYTVKGAFNPDNVFYAELSNTAGNFSSPILIGSDSSVTSGNISVTVPCNVSAHGGYKIRVISGTPTVIDTSAAFTINPVYTSTFTVNPATVCSGGPVSITYTGSAPAGTFYNWSFSNAITSGSGSGPYTANWDTAGTKNISLSVTKSGCTSATTTHAVIVNVEPTANFTADKDTVCTTSVFTYTGTASGSATYKWTLDDGTATTTTGKGPKTVTWKTEGEKTITLTVTDKGCVSATDTVYVYADICAGINTITADNTVTIYPSPAGNWLFVNGNKLLNGSLTITDVVGRTLLFKNALTTENSIDVSRLNTGVYFISVKLSNGQVVVKKLVKE